MKDNAIESAIDSIIKTNGYRGTKAELYYFFHWLRKKHALRAYLTKLCSNRLRTALNDIPRDGYSMFSMNSHCSLVNYIC